MLEKLNSKKNQVQTHIVKHRAKYAAATTAAAFVTLMHQRAKDWNAFLEEHNLTDAFYALD